MKKTLVALMLVAAVLVGAGNLAPQAAHAATLRPASCGWMNENSMVTSDNNLINQNLVLQLNTCDKTHRAAVLTWISPNFRNDSGGNSAYIYTQVWNGAYYYANNYGLYSAGYYGWWYGTPIGGQYCVSAYGTTSDTSGGSGYHYNTESVYPPNGSCQ